MFRWTFVVATIVLALFVAIGCSEGNGGSPATPSTNPDLTSGPGQTGQAQNPNTSLLGYYDIYFDVESRTMQIVEDRTASFTINIIPLLNQMTSPHNGLTISLLYIDESDPNLIKVDVDLQWYHPFPTQDQFKVYDFMGVIISNGDSTLNYHNLRVGNYGTDTYMTNADGYTRWFNPSEFTSEGFFGWTPGGIQNLEGTAKVNPYKAFGKGLNIHGDLWDWLEGGSNNDGVFKSGAGRRMKLEFPIPNDGLVFGFAVVCCWENQGSGPYSPYHRAEPVAFRVTVEDDLYYDGTASYGNLIADIDVWAWGAQPSTVLVESTVLSGIETAAPTGGGGANWSTYSIDIPAAPISSIDGHELWVIAECDSYNYINVPGVSAPPASEPLAAFYRFPLFIADTPYNTCPVIDDVYDDVMGPGGGMLEFVPSGTGIITYTCDAHDVDMDTLTFTWYITDDGVALDTSTDGIPGNAIDWYLNFGHGQWDLYVGVDDGSCETFGGPYDICANDTGAAAVAGEPEPRSDSVQTYDVQAYTDTDGDTLSWDWTITDVSTGDPVTTGWTDNFDGSIEVDWTAVGAVYFDEYTIDCDIIDICQTIPADTLDITIIDLFEEQFDTNPGDWAYAYYQYWSGCSNPTVGYSTASPWHTATGSIRYPPGAGGSNGGSLQTVVTPPFYISVSASEVFLRIWACEGFADSWDGYMNSNFKIVESSTPGLSPFISGDPAPLPAGGAYLQNSLAHGSSGWDIYQNSPCYIGPLAGQPGWTGDKGGGENPESLTMYLDLIIPASFFGKTVKVAFQYSPDWCGLSSGGAFSMDDFELWTN